MVLVPVGTVAEVMGEGAGFTLDMTCADEKHIVCSGGGWRKREPHICYLYHESASDGGGWGAGRDTRGTPDI